METKSASDINFDNQVANTPIVKEIIKDLDGLKKGQEKMESRMDTLEEKVDNGFAYLASKIDDLAETVTNNKTEALEKKLEKAEKALDRKNTNKENLKNGGLLTLLGGLITMVLENMEIINILGK